jgi:glycosyltransferase involved in cell wall biosynthesis
VTRGCLVVIPARNEAGRVEAVVRQVRKELPGVRVLVVDDGSTDDTSDRVRKAGAACVRHLFNLGYGAALQTGYKYALRNDYTRVLQMDGDGQHDPTSARFLLETLVREQADVVVGSRFLGGSGSSTTWLRRIGSRFFSWLVSRWTGVRITDPTSGYQALSRRALLHLSAEGFPEDFPDADVLIGLHGAGCTLREVGVVMWPRSGGLSMHRGYRIAYYGYKMSLSLSLLPIRKKSAYVRPRRRGKAG